MRMGRAPKRRRDAKQQTQTQSAKPKFASPTLVVGQISPDVVSSILGPAMTDLAVQSVEDYADAVLAYEHANQFTTAEEGEDVEVEMDLDGNIIQQEAPLPPPSQRLFSSQLDIENLTELLTSTSQHFSTSTNSWKVHANAAKFERLLDEKYGRFRPFIESHPNVEIFIKNVQRKYAMGAFSPFRKTGPPVGKTTSIMLLFMMHRNGVRLDAMLLAATFFLVGLQPWALVALVIIGKWEMDRRKRKRIGGMPKKIAAVEAYYASALGDDDDANLSEEEEIKAKYALLDTPVGTKFNPADLSLRDEEYDVIVLGSGPETLYAAALLARAGKKLVVLSPNDDVSGCVTMGDKSSSALGKKIPFDIDGMNVAHLSRQQELLAPALCTTTDTQGGIRFSRIGSNLDGFAHSIISVPGLGTDNTSAECIPVVLNATGSLASLAEYCSTCLGDGFPGVDLDGKDNGNSNSLSYLKACNQINSGSADYYLSKLFKTSEANAYQEASVRTASAFLNKCLPLNTHVRSLMAAIGMMNENLCPDKTSMAAHVTNVCAMTSEEGLAYPVGGPRAICHALTSVIEQCGGRVVAGVSLQELLFEKLDDEGKKKAKSEENDPTKGPKPRCKGIRLQNGMDIKVSKDDGSVISMLGFIPTFLNLLPAETRTAHGVPPGLPSISERRPLMKIMVGLKGSKTELNLTGADWYRLPNASLPYDEMDATGQIRFGTIGVDTGGGDLITEGEATEETETTSVGRRGKQSKAAAPVTAKKTVRRCKFQTGESWMKVSFPSAKDPSWHDRYGPISTCVVTVEACDDFVRAFDTKPQIYSILKGAGNSTSGEMGRLMDRVMKDLVEAFPQLEDNIICTQMCGPVRAGLSHSPARFAIKGNRPETSYPGLFVGGADLTVGDSFSASIVGGWMAANAAMGYSMIDHVYLKKNLTSDLEQFMDEPSLATERDGVVVDDVAVPFKEVKFDEENSTKAAESSKEE